MPVVQNDSLGVRIDFVLLSESEYLRVRTGMVYQVYSHWYPYTRGINDVGTYL